MTMTVVQDAGVLHDGLDSDSDGRSLRRTKMRPWNKLRPRRQDAADGLVYDHMPKAGGTFLIKLLKAGVGTGNFGKRTEFQNLTQENIDLNFVVGSVRNPCDYYLSLWAYGVEHGGAMRGNIWPHKQRDFVYNATSWNKRSAADIDKFRKWVALINMKGRPGVMSVRFAKSYGVLDRDIRAHYPPQALTDEELDSVARALATPAYLDRVNCWVKSETLEADSRRCLREWHANTGIPIDWASYRRTYRTANQLSSSHGHCRAYFTPELAQAVRTLEAPIFRDFGYTTCCS